MERIPIILFVLVLTAGLIGCTTTSNIGIDFDASRIAMVEKRKTSAADLVMAFGEPFMVAAISENEERWLYNYITRTSKGIFTVTTETHQKILEIKLKDNVVVNYRYTAGKVPSEVKTQ
jgi:hypothetical protein